MKAKRFLHLNRERGSATIEAVVAFTGFLFVIFTILNVVNICRAQMLISNAVDTAAKELTQYSYFYEMSGLSKFKDELDKNATIGADNLNEVIGTVDSFCTSVGTAYDNSAQHVTNLENAANEGNLNMDALQTEITAISNDVTNIDTSINSMEASFGAVADNPLMYMKSIVAVAGSEFVDMGISHALAAPLSKSFFTKHFGKNATEADAELEKLGVVDGLDGMNFKASTLFSKEESDDVHIVVYYKLKLIQLFKWANFEVVICKESHARAWLGGDDVITKVTPMQPPVTEEAPAEGEGTEEGTEEKTEEEKTESVDTTGSYWHLGLDEHYYDEKAAAFDNLLVGSKGVNREELVVNGILYGRDNNNVAYGMDFCVDAKSVAPHEIYLDSIESIKAMEDAYVESNGERGYKPGTTTTYTYVIYVPENISDSELAEIKKASITDQNYYTAAAKEKCGINVSVSVEIVKAGGNYDYGSEG